MRLQGNCPDGSPADSIGPVPTSDILLPYTTLWHTHCFFVFAQCGMYDSTVEEDLRGVRNVVKGPQC